jgi:hypothetical protein
MNIELTQYQQDVVKNHILINSDVMELVSQVFDNPSLDPRSAEVRAVKSYISSNKEIDKILRKDQLSLCTTPPPMPPSLKADHIDNDLLYRPQRLAAENILNVFFDRNQNMAILLGKCRSGKMNAIWHTAGRFLEESNKNNPNSKKFIIYIFSGSSTSALNDAKKTWKKYKTDENSVIKNLPIVDLGFCLGDSLKTQPDNLVKAVEEANGRENILILHQPNLTSYETQLNNFLSDLKDRGDDVLIVLDECDSYTNKEGKVNRFLLNNSISLKDWECKTPSFKVMCVSATCPAYLEKAQEGTAEYEAMWDNVNPCIVPLVTTKGYVSLKVLLELGKIEESDDIYSFNQDGDITSVSPWFRSKMNNAPRDKWNIIRYYGPSQLEALEEAEKDGLFKLHQITSKEGKNTEDMINLMESIPLKNSTSTRLIAVKFHYSRGTEVPRHQLGYIFEPISSSNQSLDWQRFMRQAGYYNPEDTSFILHCDLDLVSNIIESETSMDLWANGYSDTRPKLLRSNHYAGNTRGKLDYESKYVEIPKGTTLKEYLNNERVNCPALALDNAHRQQGEDKNLYQAAIDFNGVGYGIKRSGGIRVIDFLQDPDPSRNVPQSHKDSFLCIQGVLLDPESPQCRQGLENTGLNFREWEKAVKEKRIVQRIRPIEEDSRKTIFNTNSGIQATSALDNSDEN